MVSRTQNETFEYILQIFDAMQSSCGTADPESMEHEVHQFRKNGKRLRATLHLLRGSHLRLVSSRRRVRDASRSLSGLRDAQVLIRTVHSQLHKEKQRMNCEEIQRVQSFLEHLRRPLESSTTTWRSQLASAQAEIAIARIDFERARAHAKKLHLLQSLRDAYRRARRTTQSLHRHPTLEGFHELRKNTKAFLHQCKWAGSVLGLCRHMEPWTAPAQQLGEHIGESLDLIRAADQLKDWDKEPETRGNPMRDVGVTPVAFRWRSEGLRGLKASLVEASYLYFMAPRNFNRKNLVRSAIAPLRFMQDRRFEHTDGTLRS